MALPPTIPTSFVPRAPSSAARRSSMDFAGAYSFFAYFLFVVVLALGIGAFLYNNVLVAQKLEKDKQLVQAEAEIDSTLAQSFIRLHDRLDSGQKLLDKHVAFSNFFTTLGQLLPATVRFNSLNVVYSDTGVVSLDGSGVAKSFNALAAASASFAADGNIKDAIFSKITVGRDNSVTFSLSATLDQKLTEFTLPEAVGEASAVVSTTTQP